MADDFPSLSDIQTINDQNLADLNVSDLLQDSPLLQALYAQEASNGDQHKYVKESGAPVVGFRAANAGREWDSSNDTAVTINLKIMDATFGVDQALADTYKKGKEAYIAREAQRALRAAFSGVETQLIDGATDGDSGGFVGIREAATLEFGDAMVHNAGGTTATTGSSVYFLRTGLDDVSVVSGHDANLRIGETFQQAIEEGTGQTKFPAYVTPITGWLGLQVGSIYSMGRIVNCTEDSGKGLTDDLIYEMLSKFPASRMPNLIVMGRRSRKQLRQSRTATNQTGAPAPMPTEVDGVNIISTDAIGAVEAILS